MRPKAYHGALDNTPFYAVIRMAKRLARQNGRNYLAYTCKLHRWHIIPELGIGEQGSGYHTVVGPTMEEHHTGLWPRANMVDFERGGIVECISGERCYFPSRDPLDYALVESIIHLNSIDE